jgi:hypothetical protein
MKNFITEARRHREKSAHRAIGSSGHRSSRSSIIVKAARILLAAVHEIFDESAYDRFLHRTGAPRSKESYRVFLSERESAMSRNPRCC